MPATDHSYVNFLEVDHSGFRPLAFLLCHANILFLVIPFQFLHQESQFLAWFHTEFHKFILHKHQETGKPALGSYKKNLVGLL